MATSEEFKRQFRAGNFVEALKLALAEAAELKVTTWVAPTTTTHPHLQTQPTPGHRLLTRMNLLEGDINNEVGTAFLNDGPYSDSELWQFHCDQVESGQQTIHGNLQGLRELFATLTRDPQGQFSPADMGLIDPMVESDDLDAYDSESQLFGQIAADRPRQVLRPSIWEPSPLDGGSEAGWNDPQITTDWLPDADHQPMPQPAMPQPTIVQPQMPIVLPPPTIPPQPDTLPSLDLDLSPDVIILAPSTLDVTSGSSNAADPGVISPNQQPALEPLVFDEDLPEDDPHYPSSVESPLTSDTWDDQSALTNGLGNVQPDVHQPLLPGEDLAWADVTPSLVDPYPATNDQLRLSDPDSYEPGIRDPEDLYEPDVYYPRLPSANGGGDHSGSSAGNFSLRLLLMGMAFKLLKGQLPTAQERADLKVASAALVRDITHGRTTGESLAAGAAIIAVGAFLLWGVDRMGIVDVPFIESDSVPSTIVPPTPVTGFTMPIVLSFDFIDVSADHWAHPFITAMAERKFVEGNPEGAFEPDKQITRAEFAALIGKPLNQPPQRKSMTYKDVEKDYWAVQVIDEATRTAFMRGYPQQQFRPETSITRLEVLVALVSGLGLKPSASPATTLKVYKDYRAIPKWAAGAIAAATEAGLVVNYPDRMVLNPKKPATRAEATAMMHQALVRLGKIKPVTSGYIINK